MQSSSISKTFLSALRNKIVEDIIILTGAGNSLDKNISGAHCGGDY